MKAIKTLIIVGILGFFWNFVNAYYDITNYEINWDILIDWTINVDEKIDVNFNTEMHWIERLLDKYYTVWDLEFQVLYDKINVKNDNYTTYNEYWNTVIRLGDANKTISWKHKYDINYSMYWVIRNFSWMWYSELYWNIIWYERDTSIKNSTIELNLPKTYTWFKKEDFIISVGYNQYNNIDDFPWKITWDENKIHIEYNKSLPSNRWITLAIKFPNNYFEYDHKKQEKLFVWYTRDYKVNNNHIKWTVQKDWTIKFENILEIERYQPINYLRWYIPYKFYYNYSSKLTILKDLKINWKEFEYEEYDTTYYNQWFDLNELTWENKITSEYTLFWLIDFFTWEDPDRTNKIYLPLPIFSLSERPENIELELNFPDWEFSNVCSWIYREDIEIYVWGEKIDIDDFYNQGWKLRCENNSLYFSTNNLYNNNEINLWISLLNVWFKIDNDLLEALNTVWKWEFYFNDDMNPQSRVFLLWMILSCWWFMSFMRRRYKNQWKEKLKYIIEYDAPKWMDSSEAWAIIDDKIDDKDITALIYQRAATWYIKILSEDDKNKKFYIKKLKQLPTSTKKYQLDLFNNLFSKWDTYHFEDNTTYKDYNTLTKYISNAKKELKNYINEQKWYITDFEYASTEKDWFKKTNKCFVWCTAFLWLIAYSIIVTIINSYLKPVWSWIIFFTILWFILIITSYRFKWKEVNTEKWNEVLKHCLWYKDFLMKVDKKKFETLTKEDPTFVEKALPYAVVFWIETQFIKKITPENITRYDWDLDSLLTSVSYINRNINYNPYSYTSYSSSSSTGWYSYSSSSWHSSWSSFSWWYSSWWWWGWWWGRGR